jgi:DNA topoisomerase-1
MVVDREEEIKSFVPEEYWSIDAKLTAPPSKAMFAAAFYGDETGEIKISSKEEADRIFSELEQAEFLVGAVKKGKKNRSPAPPFITSTLQQEASRKLGFQARRTMKAAQELYEGVEVKGQGSMGLITYMRTDSLRISEDAIKDASDYIRDRWGEKSAPEGPAFQIPGERTGRPRGHSSRFHCHYAGSGEGFPDRGSV